jgi:hypothetical protein
MGSGEVVHFFYRDAVGVFLDRRGHDVSVEGDEEEFFAVIAPDWRGNDAGGADLPAPNAVGE